jgi:hypothetical protein
VAWLTGLHETDGHFYLVREQYEELLWWLLMPSLLSLAGEANPSREAIAELSKTVTEALETAEGSGYRIDEILVPDPEPEPSTEEPIPDDIESTILGQATDVSAPPRDSEDVTSVPKK